MKTIWKYSIRLRMPQQSDLRNSTPCPHSHVLHFYHITLESLAAYISCLSFYKHYFLPLIHVSCIQDLLEKSYANFLYTFIICYVKIFIMYNIFIKQFIAEVIDIDFFVSCVLFIFF